MPNLRVFLDIKASQDALKNLLLEKIKQQYFIVETKQQANFICEEINHKIYIKHQELRVCADFLSAKNQYRQGKAELICKAVGLTQQKSFNIIDATAGLGQDAFILSCYGGKVQMIEQNPLIALSLQQALIQLNKENSLFSLQNGNAIELLKPTEVVYLDPMYPHRQKSALSKKAMQIFQKLLKDQPISAHLLLNKARQVAIDRVVVKRPAKGQFLAEQKPNFSYQSKNVRFDIYRPL
jgi:16S rRNA (guanine1516-N2)-methyltransferase